MRRIGVKSLTRARPLIALILFKGLRMTLLVSIAEVAEVTEVGRVG